MRKKVFVLSVLLTFTLACGIIPYAFAVAKTPNMQIHIYLTQDAGNADLESGILDIIGWPLTKDWIDKWAQMPSTITMKGYVELGMTEIDLNNQMWPTGCPIHKFYTPSCQRCLKACEFRKAIACLTDKDTIVTDVLDGLGYRMDVPVPPSQSAYMDMYNYTQSGLIYNYNKTRAENILDAAGFTKLPSGLRQDPMTPGFPLDPIIFYIRQDDLNRRATGEMVTAELESEGIPVDMIIAGRIVCYKNVMVLYNYHMYTGAWTFGAVPDQYYDLYSSETYYGPIIGWSQNYPGFCNNGTLFGPGHADAEGFDYWALKVKYPDSIPDAITAAKTAGYLFLKFCAIIPLYCQKAVKAYRTGWTGVVNNVGYGIDNYWTFLNMYNSADSIIDCGLIGGLEEFNVVSMGTIPPEGTFTPDFWDSSSKVLRLIYETLIGYNLFNLAPTEWFLASGATVGTYTYSGAPATFINFTLRSNVYWHNDTGQPRRLFKASDVGFSFAYQYACGPGIAWNYPSLAQWLNCTIYDDTHVAVFYKKLSVWAFQWAGSLPIINKDVWNFVPPALARWYHPEEQDKNLNGIKDLYEDGTGAWMYYSYNPGNWVTLKADPQYYLSAEYISARILEMFHTGAGDVNRDGVVNVLDLALMARALGTTCESPHGTGWGQYNPDCDLNNDCYIDLMDLMVVTSNYGKTMDC